MYESVFVLYILFSFGGQPLLNQGYRKKRKWIYEEGEEDSVKEKGKTIGAYVGD